MKILFCPVCHDAVKLQRVHRSCSCGKTSGAVPDGAHATVSRDAVVIGIANDTMARALQCVDHPDSGYTTLAAWVMRKDAPRVQWEK